MTELNTLLYWMEERQAILNRKRAGLPAPWTDDPILGTYRFCNVHREDDKVTRWIADNWRAPLVERDNPDIWFWMLVARMVNNPDTLAALDPMPFEEWDEEYFVAVLERRKAQGKKVWTGAYMVGTNGSSIPKARYIAGRVLQPAWDWAKEFFRPRDGDTLGSYCETLQSLNGVHGFMAGQVIADAKYADPVLRNALDWHSFAVSGPGSRRGLNRVLGRPTTHAWKEEEWRARLEELRWDIQHGSRFTDIHAQDVQNCLCEVDKYIRTRNGEGRPRSRYQAN